MTTTITDDQLATLARTHARNALEDLMGEVGLQSDHLWDQFGDQLDGLGEDGHRELCGRYEAALRSIRNEHFPADTAVDGQLLQLARTLAAAMEHDMNYPVRHDLVLKAMHLAHEVGIPAGFGWDSKPGPPELDGRRIVAYIELPGQGQISWHMPEHGEAFDGHTTREKHDRICRWVNGHFPFPDDPELVAAAAPVKQAKLINLTPHDMHVYAPDTPDRINPADHTPVRVYPASGELARAAAADGAFWQLGADTVVEVAYTGAATGLPPYAGHMDRRDRKVWYLTSLVTALSARDRGDLLVPHDMVRDLGGRVIGCRAFGRPT